MTESGLMPATRQVYMILSPRALSYARGALESLFRNSLETLHVHLITDSYQDKDELSNAMATLDAKTHQWTVYAEEDLASREEEIFAKHSHLRAFRHGHPCWRKITDPLLLSDPNEELVLLDPDLYFPNRFTFEETPQSGLLLMWQRTSCLYPPEVVWAAMQDGIRLSHHVDIGVANWRASADLDWLDWLVGRLGGTKLPRLAHIEAIVWAALAMRVGGGHLDPEYWRCWHRSVPKRMMAKLGVSGLRILRSEPWASVKCFHAGGESKWWLRSVKETGLLDSMAQHTRPGRVIPFVELKPTEFSRDRVFKQVLRALGYYQIFRSA
jgi:hypothetical protein